MTLTNEKRERRMRRQARAIDKLTSEKKTNIVAHGMQLSYAHKYITIKNSSLWPKMIVADVVRFVLGEIEKMGSSSTLYDLTVQHTRRGGHGHAFCFGEVHLAHNRTKPRMNWKYKGISWAHKNATKTSLQSLCHIIAHELVHTTQLVEMKQKNGRNQIQQYEFETDNMAATIVSKFAKAERDFWKRYRKARRTQRNAQIRKAKAAKSRKTPDAKMDRAVANLERWQAELAKAEKHVKKWKTKVNRMTGARKAAAKRAANRA